ncbi:MAG: hypothetical protein K2N34_05525 [Lachnospiraceae bacterium]|nr:hypothetical protein [Lachnospiraceae bacterium]
MKRKKLIPVFSALLCICLVLSTCQSEKSTLNQIEADRVVISHQIKTGVYDAKATITDEETVNEIVLMHSTIQIQATSRGLELDRFVITFYSGGDMVTTWWIALSDDGTIITASETFGGGNHVVTNDFDYDRLAEILNSSVSQKRNKLRI